MTITIPTDRQTFEGEIAAYARRALENNRIKTLKQLSKFSEKEILEFHGRARFTAPKLRAALRANGLSFKK